jgi:hypothetical protein
LLSLQHFFFSTPIFHPLTWKIALSPLKNIRIKMKPGKELN